jgi:protein-S-isoprenylcysteine O-methyltransferase Ste14
MLGSFLCPQPVSDWSPLLTGTTLWALALYLPLTGPLTRLEQALAEGPLDEQIQQIALIVCSLLLALAVGAITDLGLSWALGPSWASSLGLMAVLAGAFWALSSRGNEGPRA